MWAGTLAGIEIEFSVGLRELPDEVHEDAGSCIFNLHEESGLLYQEIFRWRLTNGLGELRLRRKSGAFRMVCLARLSDAVYPSSAFEQKTQPTSKSDVAVAKRRNGTQMGGVQ